MANISEQLKYTYGYVDKKMNVASYDALFTIARADRFIGLTVNVQNLFNNISADFWLIGGTPDRFWQLKSLPVMSSMSDLETLVSTCGNYIPDGFIVTVNGEGAYKYNKTEGTWEKSEGSQIYVEGDDVESASTETETEENGD